MTRGTFRTRDGCTLGYVDEGAGLPVLWQHGLGATQAQPAEVFPASSRLRRITLECRGHGDSELGAPEALSITRFTEDAAELLDHLHIEDAVLGGLSLGGYVVFAMLRHAPAYARGLILADTRPQADAPAALEGRKKMIETVTTQGPDPIAREMLQDYVRALIGAHACYQGGFSAEPGRGDRLVQPLAARCFEELPPLHLTLLPGREPRAPNGIVGIGTAQNDDPAMRTPGCAPIACEALEAHRGPRGR